MLTPMQYSKVYASYNECRYKNVVFAINTQSAHLSSLFFVMNSWRRDIRPPD